MCNVNTVMLKRDTDCYVKRFYRIVLSKFKNCKSKMFPFICSEASRSAFFECTLVPVHISRSKHVAIMSWSLNLSRWQQTSSNARARLQFPLHVTAAVIETARSDGPCQPLRESGSLDRPKLMRLNSHWPLSVALGSKVSLGWPHQRQFEN